MRQIQTVKFHTEDGAALRVMTDEGEEIVSAGQMLLHRGLGDWLAGGGTISPYYTITAAVYANAEGTAVLATTEEAGRVLVTQAPGKADRWKALERWVAAGGKIADYAPRPAPVAQPDPVAELAAVKRLMVAKGFTSEAEIAAAIEDGAVLASRAT